MPFNPFRRFRRRLPPPADDDSDESSLDHPRVHSSDKPPKPVVASLPHTTDPLDALQPGSKSTLMCCIAAKFNISFPPLARSDARLRSRPSKRTLPGDSGPPLKGPRPPPHTVVHPPSGADARQRREAALRERGLLPLRQDLSVQEREEDERLASVPSPNVTVDGSTEAERLKASWLATNRSSEGSDPVSPPHLQPTRSPPSFDTDALRRSGDETDHPPTGKPPSAPPLPAPPLSVPSLSVPPFLEVLHEEPSEQEPFTTHSPQIIVSSKLDFPPSPTLVESSAVSCTFSSHCPGSTLESHSQSSHLSVPEKENRVPPSRKSDRSRKLARSSFSKLGTHSLTNLRRSVAGSLKSSVSSANLSTSSIAQAPRTAIDPTMHSIGSILRAAGDIQDVESRRLSEIAFLD